MNENMVKIPCLQQEYSWPEEKPNRKKDPRGWFYPEAEEIFAQLLSEDTNLVLELGSWLGKSTRFILKTAVNANVIAIDHWIGSRKWFDTKKDADAYSEYIYETFLFNCWEYKDRLIPIKKRTLDGLDEVAKYGLKPDLIHIDAGHEFAEAIGDIAHSLNLFPDAQIIGDDWNWGPEKGFPVRSAAQQIASDYGFKIVTHGTTWYYER
jgi:predicted O-methyltransferase YrrM